MTIEFEFSDSDSADPGARQKIFDLEETLRPRTLVDKVLTYTVHDAGYDLDLLDDSNGGEPRYESASRITKELGKEIAQEPDVLLGIAGQLMINSGQRSGLFGEHVALEIKDALSVWRELSEVYRQLPNDERGTSLLLGYLTGFSKRDRPAVETILDSMLEDPDFSFWLPQFQMAVGLNDRGLDRMLRALEEGGDNVWLYRLMAWGRTHEALNDLQLAKLLRRICAEEDGCLAAVEILKMRFHGLSQEEMNAVEQELRIVGQEVLLDVPLKHNRRHGGLHDYDLAKIARVVLSGADGEAAAKKVCERIIRAEKDTRVYVGRFPKLMSVISTEQPLVFLPTFFEGFEDLGLGI